MKTTKEIGIIIFLAVIAFVASYTITKHAQKKSDDTISSAKVAGVSDSKNTLTPAQYAVLHDGGTEVPFSSELLHETRKGTFVTADCEEPVFRSEQKFDSGTGWPSFWAPIPGSVELKTDSSFGVSRTEVVSAKCKSHLGHVFHDAPQTPTGDRYCINGIALKFIPDEAEKPEINKKQIQ